MLIKKINVLLMLFLLLSLSFSSPTFSQVQSGLVQYNFKVFDDGNVNVTIVVSMPSNEINSAWLFVPKNSSTRFSLKVIKGSLLDTSISNSSYVF